MKYKDVLASLMLIGLAAGVSVSQDKTYTIEYIDGVKHIHNHTPLWGDEPKVKIEFVREYGEEESVDDNYNMYIISDMCSDKEGNLYFVDNGNTRIQVFDAHGKYLRTIGREGQGPGEFMIPVFVDIDDDGILYVFDIERNGAIHKFAKDGRFIERLQMKFHMGDVYGIRLIDDDYIVFNTKQMDIPFDRPPGYGEMTPHVKIYDTDGKFIREFCEPAILNTHWDTKAYSDIFLAVDKDKNAVMSFLFQNRVEKYSLNGDILFTMTRNLNYNVEKPEYILGTTHFKTAPTLVSNGIAVDHKGRFWVCTYTRQPENDGTKSRENLRARYTESRTTEGMCVFEIFSSDGILLGKLPYDGSMVLIRIIGDRLFIWNSGAVVVSEYRIVDLE
ncbi:6-bladed beta-propeller [candidate division KSB1 bacterium]